MQFQAKSEDQLKAERLLPDGDYDFEVMVAEDKVSNKGNEMIAVKLRVFTRNGERHVYDYLMESMGFKLRHFCESTGLLSKYDAGNLVARDCNLRTGIVSIGTDPAKDGYGPKNKVLDYVVKQKDIKRPTPTPDPEPKPNQDGEDVPF